MWSCLQCGLEQKEAAHQGRRIYCSKACMGMSYQERMKGAANPYFGTAGYVCEKCGISFTSYHERKFCSQTCYHLTPKVPTPRRLKNQLVLRLVLPTPPPKPARQSGTVVRMCRHCAESFSGYRSIPRQFCSYPCFVASGGPFRAGLAASKAMLKYGPRKDANHTELMSEIALHVPVHDLSTVGGGVPDGLAWINEAWHLFDIKNPKTGYGRRGLNAVQKKWLAMVRGGPIYLLYTVVDAREFALGRFEVLKRETSQEEVAA